jgi:hypothetical protein
MRGRGDFGSRGDGRGGGFGGRGKLNVTDNTLIMIAVIIIIVMSLFAESFVLHTCN